MGSSKALQWFLKDAFMRNHKTWDEMDDWVVQDLEKMLKSKAKKQEMDDEDIDDIKAYLDLDRDDKNFNEYRIQFVNPNQINIDNYFEVDDAIEKKMKLAKDRAKSLEANPEVALTNVDSNEKPLLAKYKADRKRLEL